MSAAASSPALCCSSMFGQKRCLDKDTPPVLPPGVLVGMRPASPSADPRRQADFLFFLSSSTSVNSASTTSSFLPPELSPPGAAPPGPSGPPAAPSCACLYIASPSFIEACASALVLA